MIRRGANMVGDARQNGRLLGAEACVAIYCALVLLLPSKLIVRQVGAAGTPATLWGMFLLLWWACTRVGGDSRPVRHSPLRVMLGLLSMAVGASYATAMARGWYVYPGIRQVTDDVYDLVLPTAGAVRSAMMLAADRGAMTYAAWLGVALVALDGIRSWDAVQRLTKWIVIFGAIIAGIGAVQFFTGLNIAPYFRIPGLTAQYEFGAVDQRSVVRRVYATAVHPIEYGVLMASLLPLAIHSMIYSNPSRWRYVPVTLITFAAATSVSRSAIVGCVVGLVTLFVSWPRAWRRQLLILLPFVVVGVRLLAPGVVGTIRSLFSNLGNDPSVSGRTDDYGVAWELFLDAPWMGRGLFTLVPRYYRILDNQALVLFLELGVIGAVVFFATAVVAIGSARGARRRSIDPERRHLALAASASLSGLVVSYVTFDALSFPMVAGMTFVLFGLSGAMWNISVTEFESRPPKMRDRKSQLSIASGASHGLIKE